MIWLKKQRELGLEVLQKSSSFLLTNSFTSRLVLNAASSSTNLHHTEKRRDARNYYHKKAAPYLRKGPVTSFVPSWLRLSTEQHGLAAPPLAEAKRLKSALRNVASVGLSVQQSTSSGREGYRTYKSLPVLTEALSYQSSSTTALSYSPARRVAF
ncbi:UNVERIFIED_CONTAM: hypothetical protein Sradi_7156700 [Sesamum radiatum]|uniref:Uncharacterized protein n=1 Tax=Sesamum radiatum TaxID=300843 RepID=A0AAW2IVF4_SESRA